MPFGPGVWCNPLVTMHHMNIEEVSSFWEYETHRYAQELNSPPEPTRIRDIYYKFLAPKLVPLRHDWNNLSDDVNFVDPTVRRDKTHEVKRTKTENLDSFEKKAHRSWEKCREACEHADDCFQYVFRDGICGMSKSFKLGKPEKEELDLKLRWTSGWDLGKIQKWIQAQGECGPVSWPLVGG